jgi:hypothetical protein
MSRLRRGSDGRTYNKKLCFESHSETVFPTAPRSLKQSDLLSDRVQDETLVLGGPLEDGERERVLLAHEDRGVAAGIPRGCLFGRGTEKKSKCESGWEVSSRVESASAYSSPMRTGACSVWRRDGASGWERWKAFSDAWGGSTGGASLAGRGI